MSSNIEEPSIVNRLLTIAPKLLENARLTLLPLTTTNLLLIHCEQDVTIDPMLYLELIPIARLVQEEFGISQICIHNAQRQRIFHWSSVEIIEMARKFNLKI
ncbi:hypothetical protein H6F51_04515 [Cyanobacteria bacterium FACHB-DQ100]|nr:hypothetical protein [Cyanobacteria bacterium FACHB-DQ100]